MFDIPGTAAADAMRRMHDRLGHDVAVTGAGLTAGTIKAVASTVPGDPFQGPGRSARTHSWTVMAADLPAAPTRGMTIDDGATIWRVIDIEDEAGTGTIKLIVERA